MRQRGAQTCLLRLTNNLPRRSASPRYIPVRAMPRRTDTQPVSINYFIDTPDSVPSRLDPDKPSLADFQILHKLWKLVGVRSKSRVRV